MMRNPLGGEAMVTTSFLLHLVIMLHPLTEQEQITAFCHRIQSVPQLPSKHKPVATPDGIIYVLVSEFLRI